MCWFMGIAGLFTGRRTCFSKQTQKWNWSGNGRYRMNFLEIQNELLADHFKPAQRDRVKLWINDVYGWVWALEPGWTFRYAEDTVTVTANTSAVSGLPTDLGPVTLLLDSNGNELEYLAPREFRRIFYGATETGTPVAFTIINGAISVGPLPAETATDFLLQYEKLRTDLVENDEEPLIPSEFHYPILVHGATEIGLVRQKNPLAMMERVLRDDGVVAMRRQYLTDQRVRNAQWGGFDPEVEAERWFWL